LKPPSEIAKLLDTPESPELGPGPRKGVKPEKVLNEQLRALGANDLLRAAVLLWHDHLDAAHEIVQNIETPDGSYIHAIIHRREPDYSNAKYWFHRVGNHPCFAELAQRVEDPKVSKGQWDPFAFVDLCACSDPANDQSLRDIQALEIQLLAEHLASNSQV